MKDQVENLQLSVFCCRNANITRPRIIQMRLTKFQSARKVQTEHQSSSHQIYVHFHARTGCTAASQQQRGIEFELKQTFKDTKL